MKASRIITKETPSGKIEIIVEVEKRIFELDKSLDGFFCGKETVYVNNKSITVKLNGKKVCQSDTLSKIGDNSFIENLPQFKDMQKKYKEVVLYGYLTSNFGLTEPTYNDIRIALEECDTEVTTPETIEQDQIIEAQKEKENQIAKEEAEEYKRLINSGMCPKCGTWCYGDCEANK